MCVSIALWSCHCSLSPSEIIWVHVPRRKWQHISKDFVLHIHFSPQDCPWLLGSKVGKNLWTMACFWGPFGSFRTDTKVSTVLISGMDVIWRGRSVGSCHIWWGQEPLSTSGGAGTTSETENLGRRGRTGALMTVSTPDFAKTHVAD